MFVVHIVASFFSKLQEDPTKKVDRFLYAMHLHDDQLSDISARFQAEMKKGLSVESNAAAALKMLPTHVRSTPDGSEKGEFLALDLGGSRFKVLQVKVGEATGIKKGGVEMVEKTYPTPEESSLLLQLFDHVSESLKDFLHEKNISLERKHPLAFTFSFPCEQSTLNQGLLLNWTKNFRAGGLQGKDVVQALRGALDRIGGVDVEVLAMVNDTVATMMTCGFDDQQCEVGLIIGTGTNACYMEELRHIDLVEGDEGRMCVNTEWGAFGDDGALKDYVTEFDRDLDAASNNPGKQILEKMVGGMYLGELVRLVVLKMAKLGLLFKGQVSKALRTKGTITTEHVAAMEEYKNGLNNTRDLLMGLDLIPTFDDCVAVQHVSTIVSFRSSNLVSAGLAAILTRIMENRNLRKLRITVGVDGTVYKMHPQYPKRLHKVVRRLLPECHVRFVLSDSGSSKGAALVSAVAQRLASRRRQVDGMLSPFRLSQEQLRLVKTRMRTALEAGLKSKGSSAVKMLPSFVYRTPDGTEHGKYLALHLGETNFRASLVKFKQGLQHNSRLYNKMYTIPLEIKQGSGEELFDYIAQCVGDFLDYMGMKKARLPAGFTFSFPCEHTAVDKCTLVSWNKGFKATDCEGRDVVSMLREAIKRRNEFDLDVAAVVNDTVATMMSCAYEDPRCEIGLIVGTGCNVCYMEEGSERAEGRAGILKMCINTEWGGLGDDGSLDDIITPHDIEVDQHSLNPAKQREDYFFRGQGGRNSCVNIILSGSANTVLFCVAMPIMVCVVVQVCGAVSRRAAQLCGAGMAAVVDKIRENRGLDHLNISVGVDGTLYKLHPHFSGILQGTVRVLAPQCTVTFLPSEEGSGKGAALITAVARQKLETSHD
uniref:hexokinase n=2 Tax=Gasterosteus aculeatus aculeatus TaxID=481459 RepID=G3PUC9_GASAC